MSSEQVAGLGMGLLFLLTGVACAIWMGRRRQAGPHPWTILDALASLVALVAFWGAGLLIYQSVTGAEEELFLAQMVITALGGGCCLGLVFMRATPAELGLLRCPWRWCLLGLALIVPFMLLTGGWVYLVEWLTGPQDEQDIVQTVRSSGSDLNVIAAMIYAIGIAPILEEILFRGFLLGAIQRTWGANRAILLSGFVFGIFHFSNPFTVVPLVIMGFCTGWLRIRSASIWPGWAMHIGFNSTSLALVVLASG